MAQQAFDYRFHYGEPGLFLEIYVPTAYQDILRDTIEKGFDLDFVKAHLKASDNACEVRQLLQDHETLATYDEARVNRLNPVLDGYSIYRGDGAFFNGGHLQRDDVSVVRMMFLPPLETLSATHHVTPKVGRFTARRFLRFWTHDGDDYREYRRTGGQPLSADEDTFVKALQEWLDDIGLVVNGYIIHRLSREIAWRRRVGLVQKSEDQIWVGTLRCLAVNKVVRC